MFNLPTESQDFKSLMPSSLVIGSHQGTGKTTAVALLPNCLVLDLEGGSTGYGGMCLDLKKQKETFNMKNPNTLLTDIGAFNMFIKSLEESNQKKGDYVYDYLAVDTLTALQKLSETYATNNFNKGNIGKAMAKKNNDELVKDVVSELADGAGYRWLFNAFSTLRSKLEGLTRHGVIWLGHTKQGSLLKSGQNVSARDLELTGKLKLELLRDATAAGYLYRSDANTVMISFKSDERDLLTKSRCSHLAEKEFIFSKLNGDTLTVYWNEIYPDYIKQPIVKKIR